FLASFFGAAGAGAGAAAVGAGAAAGVASAPHWALRKSFHFWPASVPADLAAWYFALHSCAVRACAGEVAIVVGSVTAIVSVVLLAEAFGLPRGVILSPAPKSVTAGVAMGISESLHADPSLTAVSVILTGIMGAIIVTPLMNRAGITDFRARGFAVGIAAHGIGTARAFQVDPVAGVFAGIAMSLNALVTSLLVPLAVTILVR